jgi:hypothetical protein
MSSPENSGAPGADAYASDTLDHHGLVAGLVEPSRVRIAYLLMPIRSAMRTLMS